MSRFKTVLFDLDGTLIDTAPDMANALNILLDKNNRKPLDYAHIRPEVSNGSVAMVKLGFPDENNPQTLAELKQSYLDIYQNNLCIDSQLFPGMAQLIEHIESQQMNWGVVTNKPGWLTEPLMQQLELTQRAATIISGDTTANRKPHPEPMYLACKQADTQPNACVYLGDAQRDIQAGNNAGMTTVIANYGYIGDWENPEEWGADLLIDQPLDMLGKL